MSINPRSQHNRLRRRFAILASATAAFMSIGLIPVHADSADPVLPFHASVNLVGGQPVLTLDGNWQWTTHHSDCNLNRYAVGYAVDWNDSTTPGNLVGTVNNQTVAVGTPTDNTVHFNHLAGDTASGADSGDPNSTNDPTAATRCGTYSASDGFNSGTWGPISHTYPAGTTTFSTCLVTYDMHLSGNGLQKGDDVAGGNGHNGDNSVQSNNNTPLGNQCFTFFVPSITTDSSPSSVVSGTGFADTATLSGVDPGNVPTGTITFTLHSALGNDPNGCGGTVVRGPYDRNVVKLSSNPDVYGAVSPTVHPSAAGTYYWQASYSGDNHNAAVDGKCSDAHEHTRVTNPQVPPPPPTGDLTIIKAVNHTTANYGDTLTYTLHVTANGTLDETNVEVSDVIPGYDPSHGASGNTTYVAGSADCSGSGTCVTHYNSATHTVSWNIGTLAAGDTRNVTFKVTINTPRRAADGSLPHERIDNSAVTSSKENPSSEESNVVHTGVNAVLGEKITRPKKVKVLPFTGSPTENLALLGGTLLAVGMALTTVGRRRKPRFGTQGPTDLA